MQEWENVKEHYTVIENQTDWLPCGCSWQRPAAVHPYTPAVTCSSVTLRWAVATVCSAFWDETLFLPRWTHLREQRRSLTLTRLRTLCTNTNTQDITTVYLWETLLRKHYTHEEGTVLKTPLNIINITKTENYKLPKDKHYGSKCTK